MAKKLYSLIVKVAKGLAYFSVLLQWFFLVVIYLSIASEQRWFNDIMAPVPAAPVITVEYSPIVMPSLVAWLLSGLVLILLLVVIVYTFRYLPGSLVRAGDSVTHKPADVLAPVLMKLEKQHPTKKRQLVLTRRLIFIIKGLLVILPVALLWPVGLFGWPMDPNAAWAVAWFLAGASTVLFLSEYLLSKTLLGTIKLSD